LNRCEPGFCGRALSPQPLCRNNNDSTAFIAESKRSKEPQQKLEATK
jgi:hypothetical protein